MSFLLQFCQWLNETQWAITIRESEWLFPIIETVHVLGITLLVGTVLIVDLRLLGCLMRREPVIEVAGQILPLTWIGFFVMFVSGFLLFMAEAAKSYANPAFRVKLLLLILVGLNPLIFHLTIYRKVDSWGKSLVSPLRARFAALASILLWSGVIVAGRAYAYF